MLYQPVNHSESREQSGAIAAAHITVHRYWAQRRQTFCRLRYQSSEQPRLMQPLESQPISREPVNTNTRLQCLWTSKRPKDSAGFYAKAAISLGFKASIPGQASRTSLLQAAALEAL